MANKVIVLILSILSINFAKAQLSATLESELKFLTAQPIAVSTEEEDKIYSFLFRILQGDKEFVAKKFHYPIRFEYPVEFQIENEQEFILHYDALFPPHIKEMLLSQRCLYKIPNVMDGEKVLIGGILQATFHSDDFDIPMYYHYIYTSAEDKIKAEIEYKLKFHSSVRAKLLKPIGFIETEHYKVLIDYSEKAESYRYSCWKINKSTLLPPDIIIENGVIGDGSKGGRWPIKVYTFRNGEYTYTVEVSLFGALLSVDKEQKSILIEEALSIDGFGEYYL